MSDPALRHAQALIENDQVEDALLYLAQIDHPLADEWREQLRAAAYPKNSAHDQRRVLIDGEMPLSDWDSASDDSWSASLSQREVVNREQGLSILSHFVRSLPPGVLVGSAITSVVVVMMLLTIPAGPIILLLLVGLLGLYAYQAEEVTQFDRQAGVVRRHYSVFDWPHYSITAQVAERTLFGGDLPQQLYYPPSISALVSPPQPLSDADQGHAATILQAAIGALWAWGLIDIYEITIQHSLIGRDIFFSRIQILVPAQETSSLDVDGELERQIMLVIERWANTHHDQYAAKPWKPGPTFRELAKSLRSGGTPFHAQILEIARSDAIGRGLAVRRGWRKKFEMTEDSVKALGAEAHNVQVLMQRIAHYHPSLATRLLKGITANFDDSDTDD